jgi:5-methylcytosine-specific restriction endonuclease McrA
MVARACLGLPGKPCGTPYTGTGSRCEACRLVVDRIRDARNRPTDRTWRWHKFSRRILSEHRRNVGPWCPGAADLDHDAHPSFDLTLDHIVPLAAGGAEFDRANVRPLCRSANSARGDRGSPPGPTTPHNPTARQARARKGIGETVSAPDRAYPQACTRGHNPRISLARTAASFDASEGAPE